MIVIGTAGHIDHGKSSIVKRLTGTDPDRLPEEKERGMTIDLGFAFYTTSENDTIAFIDVPGHERFVKNMIAGAGGIDVVILVVAADDGWMPQTEEHFQIVRLLGVKTGLVVINKCDLVNQDSLKSLRSGIKQKVANSFLENAPIFEISTISGNGFEELQAALKFLAENARSGQDIGKARLYIDRVFVRPGIGHVATGTLKDGGLIVGETINIWPTMKTAKIKSLQTNNESVSESFPSQRTAVSLTGIGKEALIRGGAITGIQQLEYFSENPVLALKIELLKNAPVTIDNKRKVLLLVGTSEAEGEIRLLDKNKISAGQSGILLFKPKSPLLTLVGDRVIIRLPSPMVTLGGGVVLDHLKSIPSQKNLSRMHYLQSRDISSIQNLIISELQKEIVVNQNELLEYSNHSNAKISAAVNELIQESRCGKTDGILFEPETFSRAADKVYQTVTRLISAKKGIGGLTLKEMSDDASLQENITQNLLTHLVDSGQLQKESDLYRIKTSVDEIPPDVQSARDELIIKLNKNPLMPPTLSELTAKGKAHKEAVRLMLKSGEIHKCGADFVFPSNVWKEFEIFITKTLSRQETLSVADFRDWFKITRKFAVPILEEMDKLKLTRRRNDIRIKGEKLEN